MANGNLDIPDIDCSSWMEGCMIHTDFFESPAAANGNMVACLSEDVLHVMVPELLQNNYPRDAFISDLGNVRFVYAAFAASGEIALRLSFEDGTATPYQIHFQRKHFRLIADNMPIITGRTGWMQFHFGPDEFSRIIEYPMLVSAWNRVDYPVPAPPEWHFDPNKISHASEIRVERFVDRFFELCGNDCYDFEEFLAEVYRLFKHEWEYLKCHLIKPWNEGAEKYGRDFLRVSETEGLRLVSEPRVDFTDFLNPDSNVI